MQQPRGRERITPTFIALSLVAVAGMVLIVYDPSSTGGQWIGVALTVAGIGCCAVYSVVTRRWIPDAKETSQVVVAQQGHAFALALGLVLLVGLAGGTIVPTALTPLGFASAIGSGVLVLRRRLLVLSRSPAPRAGVLRSGVVLPHPDRRGRRRRAASRRTSRSAPVARRGDRPGRDPRHHPPALAGAERGASGSPDPA